MSEAVQEGNPPPATIAAQFKDEAKEMLQRPRSCPKGEQMSLFNISRTNMVESDINTQINSGVRNNIPPLSFYWWAKRLNTLLQKVQSDAKLIRDKGNLPEGALVPMAQQAWMTGWRELGRICVEDLTVTESGRMKAVTALLFFEQQRRQHGFRLSLSYSLETGALEIQCPCPACSMNKWVCKWMMKIFAVAKSSNVIPEEWTMEKLKCPSYMSETYYLKNYSSGSVMIMPDKEPGDMCVGDLVKHQSSLIHDLPKSAPPYKVRQVGLNVKAEKRIQSRGELSQGATQSGRRRTAGRYTVQGAQVKRRRVTEGYLNRLVALEESGALYDTEWNPDQKSEEEVALVNSFLPTAPKGKKGCGKCGNPKAVEKWCSCKLGPAVKPSDLRPGDYSLYIINGTKGDLLRLPPDLHCESSGLNGQVKVKDACQKFCELATITAAKDTSILLEENSEDISEEQETVTTVEEENVGVHLQGEDQEEEDVGTLLREDQEEQEENSEDISEEQETVTTVEEENVGVHLQGEDQEEEDVGTLLREDQEEQMVETEEEGRTNICVFCYCQVQEEMEHFCYTACCWGKKMHLTCMTQYVKTREELNEDPSNIDDENATVLTSPSPHGRIMHCPQCDNMISRDNPIFVKTLDGNTYEYGMDVQEESRDMTRTCRLLLVSEWEKKERDSIIGVSSTNVVQDIMRGYAATLRGIATGQRVEEKNIAKCGEILDEVIRRDAMHGLEELWRRSKEKVFELIHRSITRTGVSLDDEVGTRATNLINHVVDATRTVRIT